MVPQELLQQLLVHLVHLGLQVKVAQMVLVVLQQLQLAQVVHLRLQV